MEMENWKLKMETFTCPHPLPELPNFIQLCLGYSSQRRIQNPVKHLRWVFLQNAVTYFSFRQIAKAGASGALIKLAI